MNSAESPCRAFLVWAIAGTFCLAVLYFCLLVMWVVVAVISDVILFCTGMAWLG